MGGRVDNVVLLPRQAAQEVCHEDQLVIWASEFASALGPYLRDDLSYDDLIDVNACLKREISRTVERAFDHPEVKSVKQRG